MITYINETVKDHKSSLAKFLMETLIEKNYEVIFIKDKDLIKEHIAETFYFDKNGCIYRMNNAPYKYYTISSREFYTIIQKDNKNDELSLQEWREIFLMASSADFSTANLSFRLIKNTLLSEAELTKVVLMTLNKFKDNTNVQKNYPEFIQDLDYLNRMLLPVHLQGKSEELSIDLLVQTIRAVKGDEKIISILNDEVIKKLFTRKYDHWLNIQLQIKGA